MFFFILVLKLVLHEVACSNDDRILSQSYGVFLYFFFSWRIRIRNLINIFLILLDPDTRTQQWVRKKDKWTVGINITVGHQ